MDTTSSKRDCDITSVTSSHISENTNNSHNSHNSTIKSKSIFSDKLNNYHRDNDSKIKKIEQENVFQLQNFDITKEYDLRNGIGTGRTGSSTLIIGKRGCGKSTAVVNIVSFLKIKENTNICIVFSSTEKYTKFYTNSISPIKLYDEFTEESLNSILKNQSEKIGNCVKNKIKIPELILIIDDCDPFKMLKSDSFQELMFNGRHYHISVILTMQFPMTLSPSIRCNMDYVFLTNDCMISNKKKLYDYYAGMFPTFSSFNSCLDTLENYCFLAIKNCVDSQFENKVTKFKPNLNLTCNTQEPINVKNNAQESINIKNNTQNDIFVKSISSSSTSSNANLDQSSVSSIDFDAFLKLHSAKGSDSKIKSNEYKLLKNIAECNLEISKLLEKTDDDKKIKIFAKVLKSNKIVIDHLNKIIKTKKQKNKLPKNQKNTKNNVLNSKNDQMINNFSDDFHDVNENVKSCVNLNNVSDVSNLQSDFESESEYVSGSVSGSDF